MPREYQVCRGIFSLDLGSHTFPLIGGDAFHNKNSLSFNIFLNGDCNKGCTFARTPLAHVLQRPESSNTLEKNRHLLEGGVHHLLQSHNTAGVCQFVSHFLARQGRLSLAPAYMNVCVTTAFYCLRGNLVDFCCPCFDGLWHVFSSSWYQGRQQWVGTVQWSFAPFLSDKSFEVS